MKLLICADIHLRDTQPIARVDDYWEAQWKTWEYVQDIFQQTGCAYMLIAGDLGDKPEWSNRLLYQFLIESHSLATRIVFVPGQHDLPHHQKANFPESGCGILSRLGWINYVDQVENNHLTLQEGDEEVEVYGYWYGDKDKTILTRKDNKRIKILLLHKMVIDQPLWPGQKAMKQRGLAVKYPNFNLIGTGDNHRSFMVQEDGKPLLFNPGSMMRMAADQMDHKPIVGVYDTIPGSLLMFDLPYSNNELSDSHIKAAEKRKKIAANIAEARFSPTGTSTKLFRERLQSRFEKDETRKEIRDIVWGAME